MQVSYPDPSRLGPYSDVLPGVKRGISGRLGIETKPIVDQDGKRQIATWKAEEGKFMDWGKVQKKKEKFYDWEFRKPMYDRIRHRSGWKYKWNFFDGSCRGNLEFLEGSFVIHHFHPRFKQVEADEEIFQAEL